MFAPTDVVKDAITDLANRRGYQFVEQVFYEACKDAGFSNAKDRAQALHRVWIREGYKLLPDWTKDFVLRAMNGEMSPPRCPECQQSHCHHSH